MFSTALISLALGCIGLIDSVFIHFKKKRNEKLVCFIGDDCDRVVQSKYSTIFGIPHEVAGIVYYSSIIVLSVLFLFGLVYIAGVQLYVILLLITSMAALFSLGLIFIQGILIREWCEYCLISAGASLLLFWLYAIPYIAVFL